MRDWTTSDLAPVSDDELLEAALQFRQLAGRIRGGEPAAVDLKLQPEPEPEPKRRKKRKRAENDRF